MEIVQIVIICLCATILIIILNDRKEFGVYIGIVTIVIVFFIFTDQFKMIVDMLQRMNDFMNIDDIYMKILLQIIGIAFVTEFGSGLCKDSGQKAIAANIELAGKVMILVISAPIILAIVNLIENII